MTEESTTKAGLESDATLAKKQYLLSAGLVVFYYQSARFQEETYLSWRQHGPPKVQKNPPQVSKGDG